ncbi:hypothetical protein ACLF6K_01395 [Streptomyces xanthophaeus]|uniref:hypothetical protein n=1 Tax=Streptomyces xanthophaeus TaxID=67385 RepID=UPI0039900753
MPSYGRPCAAWPSAAVCCSPPRSRSAASCWPPPTATGLRRPRRGRRRLPGPLACYAAAVLLSLAAYFVLPFRASTLAMVAGLAPLTLLRPLVVAGVGTRTRVRQGRR